MLITLVFFLFSHVFLFFFWLKVATYDANSDLNIYDSYGNLIQFLNVNQNTSTITSYFTSGLEWSSNDGILISTDAATYNILLWNTTTYTQITTLTGGHTNEVTDLQLLDDVTLVSSSLDGYINIWNLTSGHIINQLNDGVEVFCIKLLKNRSLLASGDFNGELKIWNLTGSTTSTLLYTLSGHTNIIYALEVIDEKTMASASEDQTVYVWDLATYTNKIHFTQHSQAVTSLKLIGNGIIASGSNDNLIYIWNTTDGNVLHALTGHTDSISKMDLLSVNVLVSVSVDKTIRMWDIATGALLKTLTESNRINSVKMSNSKKVFLFLLVCCCF